MSRTLTRFRSPLAADPRRFAALGGKVLPIRIHGCAFAMAARRPPFEPCRTTDEYRTWVRTLFTTLAT